MTRVLCDLWHLVIVAALGKSRHVDSKGSKYLTIEDLGPNNHSRYGLLAVIVFIPRYLDPSGGCKRHLRSLLAEGSVVFFRPSGPPRGVQVPTY